jgi:hypothetical protein
MQKGFLPKIFGQKGGLSGMPTFVSPPRLAEDAGNRREKPVAKRRHGRTHLTAFMTDERLD